jgi:riboflavin biosynthesis pyrimidine reductase
MRRGVGVRVVDRAPEGVSLRQVLDELCRSGVESLLVEGGGRVITSLLRAGLVDRMVVALAPTILGEGTAAVGDLGTESVLQGIALEDRYSAAVGDDLVVAGDIARP